MKIGIICEYNPFHNGHKYHLDKIKEMFPNAPIILIMSGNFTERGDVSLIDKWTKTEIALDQGVDLVVELPFAFATQSADYFAKGAISLLKELKVTHLVFGSELDSVLELEKVAKVQLEHPDYDKLVSSALDEGYNYPTALNIALEKLGANKIDKPNDLLGVSYIKEIIKQEANIIPVSIKRTNDFHSKDLSSKIVSATAIRKSLTMKNDVSEFIPYHKDKLKNLHFFDDYFQLLRYQIYVNYDNLGKFKGVDEGIEARIKDSIKISNNIEELIKNIKTKRYTYQRISRMLIHILCGYTKEMDAKMKEINYIRVLGFSKKGQDYLNSIKKDITLPIVTRFASLDNEILKLEKHISNIYYLTSDNFNDLEKLEYSKNIIIKK